MKNNSCRTDCIRWYQGLNHFGTDLANVGPNEIAAIKDNSIIDGLDEQALNEFLTEQFQSHPQVLVITDFNGTPIGVREYFDTRYMASIQPAQ